MTRKSFLKLCTALLASPFYNQLLANEKEKMPALFIGHGSPMNIIRDNTFTKNLKNITKTFSKPKAIIVISAHWYESETIVSSSIKQNTIYDFYGFPHELYKKKYEPKGNPNLAKEIASLLGNIQMQDRGLDHGAWSVLTHMYPNQDIPTFQISINKNFSYLQHYQIGNLLARLREHGVLIIGSGNITHNLSLVKRDTNKIDYWSFTFDEFIKDSFNNKNFANIVYAQNHKFFKTAHPFDDHYIPLLYTAGLMSKKERVNHFHEEIVSGNLSMRCIKIG